MTADLAEEHSTATLATERLEAEQSDRMRLEKEKGELEVKGPLDEHSNKALKAAFCVLCRNIPIYNTKLGVHCLVTQLV